MIAEVRYCLVGEDYNLGEAHQGRAAATHSSTHFSPHPAGLACSAPGIASEDGAAGLNYIILLLFICRGGGQESVRKL